MEPLFIELWSHSRRKQSINAFIDIFQDCVGGWSTLRLHPHIRIYSKDRRRKIYEEKT